MARPEKVQIEIEIPDLIDAVIASLKEHETLVEVVRCGECRWHKKRGRCVNFDAFFTDDFYCAYGERRADDETD